MQNNFIVLLCVFVLFSIPLIMPFVASIGKFKYFGLERNIVRRYMFLSVFVVFIVAANFSGLRFQTNEANIVFKFLALVCFLNLISLAFQIKPRLIGIILGVLTVVLSLFLILFIILSFETEDKISHIKLTPSTYCEVNRYSYILEGGFNVSIYKYLGFGISRRLFRDSYPDEISYPFQDQVGACNYSMAKLARRLG